MTQNWMLILDTSSLNLDLFKALMIALQISINGGVSHKRISFFNLKTTILLVVLLINLILEK